MKVADYILDQLAAWGVRHVYGVTGDAILPLMDALSRHQTLRFIPVRHETAAGFMASAEGKLTGRPAVCVGTSGPGLANLINGIADAHADRVPLIVLTGQVESYKVGTDVKQYADQQALVRPLVGYTAMLTGPDAAPQIMVQALKTAVAEGRVAQVSVPKDYWTADIQAQPREPEPFLTAPPVAGDDVIKAAAALLRQSRRPLILAGHGARPAAGDLLALAETWGAGITLALGGKGMIPSGHPLLLGGVGTGGSDAAHRALQECDLLLVAGSTWWPKQYMPTSARVVQLDRCPANIGAQTEVDFGLAGDARQVVPALLAELRADPGPARNEWFGQFAQWWGAAAQTLAAERRAAPDGPIPPAYLAHALGQVLTPGAIVALDTGDHLLWFNRHVAADDIRTLFSGTWRSMGFGLPAASAAKLCEPGAQVVALVGDGGLTMLLGELAVPAQQGLPLTVVVARNGSLALEEFKARSEGLTPFGHVLNNPDFAAVARAFGWQAWRVERPDELGPALEAAVAAGGPALVDVWTEADPGLHLTQR